MSVDKLVLDLSQEIDTNTNVFQRKDWLNIMDNQNQNYSGNQIVADSSQLSNSNKYINYREAYLMIPLFLTLSKTTVGGEFTPATDNENFAIGLKNWFGNMIHNLSLEFQGSVIVQQTNFINIWNAFKLMTSLSWGDVLTQGASIGFYPDDPMAFVHTAAAAVSGIGVANNSNAVSFVNTAASNNNANGNMGFFQRCRYINFDPTDSINGATSTYSNLLSSASTSTIWKSYLSTCTDGAEAAYGAMCFSITATVYLKHLHSFFNNVPLLKGAFFKLTMNVNNTVVNFTSAGDGGNLTLNSVSVANSGTCPIMIASSTSGANHLGAGDYVATLQVGKTCLNSAANATLAGATGQVGSSVFLYAPAYAFNAVFEQAYLSNPVKLINYTDIYYYEIQNINGNGGQINNLVTNGIANLKSVLVLPVFNTTSSGTGYMAYQSPFDPCGGGPTSPLCLINNFNVVISGQNAIYNTQKYSFEEWNNQLYGQNAVNGGMTDGITSGLIDKQGFEMEYCYHYVNVSRCSPVEESVPKSISIIGTNQSQKAINLMVFCEYGVSVSFDVLTGARV